MSWKVIGINDDQDHCDFCGKQGLKRVVWIENTETMQMAALGTDCAARTLGVKGTKTQKQRTFQDMATATDNQARKDVFRNHCRLVRNCFIPTDFDLGATFRQNKADGMGMVQAMDKAIVAGQMDRIARWPVTK